MPSRSITLAQIGKKGNLYMSKVPPVLGVSHIAFAVQAPAFAAQLARVEVDPDTGELTLHDFVVVQDAGKAINPLGVEGQMQGGAVQSLGFALTEALLFDEKGRLTNPSLLDYRKLTAADLPNIETIIVEVPVAGRPLRRARRRRAPDRARAGGHRQRGLRRHRRADHRAADHAGADRDGSGRGTGERAPVGVDARDGARVGSSEAVPNGDRPQRATVRLPNTTARRSMGRSVVARSCFPVQGSQTPVWSG